MKAPLAKILPQPPAAPLDIAEGQCLLFAYGQLQPQQRPPQTLVRAWPDRVRGLLYDLGPYPAAVQIGAVDAHFHGFVLEIATAELTGTLDPFEQLDKGIYRRIRTVTESGFGVWLYEYAMPLPKHALGPIDRWCAARGQGFMKT